MEIILIEAGWVFVRKIARRKWGAKLIYQDKKISIMQGPELEADTAF